LDNGQSARWSFEVYDRLYQRLAQLARYYYRGSRCGVDTDFHPDCHGPDRNESGTLICSQYWVFADHSGSFEAPRPSGGKNAATILSLR
jgi:hypothetical protein